MIYSKNFLNFSRSLDSVRKRLSVNPKIRRIVTCLEDIDEQEIDMADWAIPLCQLKTEPTDRMSYKLKTYCQLCLKAHTEEESSKVYLNEKLQENFFELTRKQVETSFEMKHSLAGSTIIIILIFSIKTARYFELQ